MSPVQPSTKPDCFDSLTYERPCARHLRAFIAKGKLQNDRLSLKAKWSHDTLNTAVVAVVVLPVYTMMKQVVLFAGLLASSSAFAPASRCVISVCVGCVCVPKSWSETRPARMLPRVLKWCDERLLLRTSSSLASPLCLLRLFWNDEWFLVAPFLLWSLSKAGWPIFKRVSFPLRNDRASFVITPFSTLSVFSLSLSILLFYILRRQIRCTPSNCCFGRMEAKGR